MGTKQNRRGKRSRAPKISAIFAANLRRVCERKKITAARLATKAGIDVSHAQELLAGACDPTLILIGRLARALGVAAKSLLKTNIKEQRKPSAGRSHAS